MKKLNFNINISVETETGRIIAIYFQFRKGRAAEVREFAQGNAFANYGSDGQLLGVELLGPCEIAVLDKIARKEPKEIKRFMRETLPAKMAVAS